MDVTAFARAVADEFLDLDLATRVERALGDAPRDSPTDVLALGKAAPELVAAARVALGARTGRTLVVTDEAGALVTPFPVVVGTHPVPSAASARAGEAALEFVASSSDGLVVLVSGGTSAMCAVPDEPVTLADFEAIWSAALATGADISVLNTVRAACSRVARGRLLAASRARWSRGLVMVDNVLDGAPGVGSGPTYPAGVDRTHLRDALAQIGVAGTPLADRVFAAAGRSVAPTSTSHRNETLVEPRDAVNAAIDVARRHGFGVIDVGAALVDDVEVLAGRIALAMRDAPPRSCVIGAGEAGVVVRGAGRGGRCQELAVHVALALATFEREFCFVARATDGRDHVADVSGAWVDPVVRDRLCSDARTSMLLANSSSHELMERAGGLLAGQRTGWNLCDLYIGVVL